MSAFWGLPDSRLHEDARETIPPSQLLPLTSNTFLFLISLLIESHTDNRSSSICKIQLRTCKRLEIHLVRCARINTSLQVFMQNERKQKPKQEKGNDKSQMKEKTQNTPRILRSTGLQSFAFMRKQSCSEPLNDLIVNMKSTSLY